MYYILVRVWTVFMFIFSPVLGYIAMENLTQTNEVGLFLGCGAGIAMWFVGVVMFSVLLHPKRTPDMFK